MRREKNRKTMAVSRQIALWHRSAQSRHYTFPCRKTVLFKASINFSRWNGFARFYRPGTSASVEIGWNASELASPCQSRNASWLTFNYVERIERYIYLELHSV